MAKKLAKGAVQLNKKEIIQRLSFHRRLGRLLEWEKQNTQKERDLALSKLRVHRGFLKLDADFQRFGRKIGLEKKKKAKQ